MKPLPPVLVCLLLIGLPKPVPAEDVKRLPPLIETRMWCPADIEEYFQELKSKELAAGSNYWKVKDSVLVQATKTPIFMLAVNLSGLGLVDSWLNDALPSEDTTPPHSVVMRNVAYDYLRTWPRSRGKLQQYIGMNVPGSDEAIYGKHFLKWFYEVFQRQKSKLMARVFDGGTQFFEQEYAKWEGEWGPDPAVAPARVPKGYVEEEFDGNWYLSVKLESENLLYYACMVKQRHIFGPWDSTNASALSHIISRDKVIISPYPVRMRFYLSARWKEKAVKFSDDVLQAHRPGDPWVDIKARSYRGPAGASPHVSYEFDYPIYDYARKRWHRAKAVLASAPGPEFQEVRQTLRGFQAQGIEGMGEDLRNWAGKYRQPDG